MIRFDEVTEGRRMATMRLFRVLASLGVEPSVMAGKPWEMWRTKHIDSVCAYRPR